MGRQGSASRWVLSCLALLLVTGCGRKVTHLDPAADATWGVLNREAGADSVVIGLSGGLARPARDPRFAPDVARWTDPASGEEQSVPSEQLNRISFRSEWRGISAGIRFGLVTGGTITAAGLFAARGQGPLASPLALAGGVIVTGGLILLGAAIGGVDAGWEDFVLTGSAPEDRAPPESSRAGAAGAQGPDEGVPE